MATKKKLSMSEFKALRQSRSFLDQGHAMKEHGDLDAALLEFQKVILCQKIHASWLALLTCLDISGSSYQQVCRGSSHCVGAVDLGLSKKPG